MTRQEQNSAFLLTSFLYGGNAEYIEELYAKYQENPASVDDTWRSFFLSSKIMLRTSKRVRPARLGSGQIGREPKGANWLLP